MKRKYLLGLLFLWPFLIAETAKAQSYTRHVWFDHFVREAANNRTTPQADTIKVGFPTTSDSLWAVRTTNKDTSRVYETSPYMSLWLQWTDAANDSVHLKIKWLMATPGPLNPGKMPIFNRFVTIDSLTITRDGTQEQAKYQVITQGNIPNFRYIYFTVEGLSQNDKSAGVSGKMILSHWDESALRQ